MEIAPSLVEERLISVLKPYLLPEKSCLVNPEKIAEIDCPILIPIVLVVMNFKMFLAILIENNFQRFRMSNFSVFKLRFDRAVEVHAYHFQILHTAFDINIFF